LQRRAGDLLGIDHARLDEVFVSAGGDVVTVVAFAAFDFFDDDRAFDAGVVGQRAGGILNARLTISTPMRSSSLAAAPR
jgi:hypothetical protein